MPAQFEENTILKKNGAKLEHQTLKKLYIKTINV